MEKPVRIGFLALGALGALALIIADFSTLYEVTAITASLKKVAGHSQHTYGLVLLGLFAAAMVWGAAVGRSRPATIALTATGVIAALIVLIGDLNNVTSTGVYGRNYSNAKASPKSGFYLETLGAALLLSSGGGLLLLEAPIGRRVTADTEPATTDEPPAAEPPRPRRAAPEPAPAPASGASGRTARGRRERPPGQARKQRQPRSQAERERAAEARRQERAGDPAAASPKPARRPRRKPADTRGKPAADKPAQQPAPQPTARTPEPAAPDPAPEAPAVPPSTAREAAQAARKAAGRAVRRRLAGRKPPPG